MITAIKKVISQLINKVVVFRLGGCPNDKNILVIPFGFCFFLDVIKSWLAN